jgi:hypothetical protein
MQIEVFCMQISSKMKKIQIEVFCMQISSKMKNNPDWSILHAN